MRPINLSLTFSGMLLALMSAPDLAHAQPATHPGVSLTTGIALTSQYDDETHLGRGVLLSVGVSSLVWDHLRVEGDWRSPAITATRARWRSRARRSPVRRVRPGCLDHARRPFAPLSARECW